MMKPIAIQGHGLAYHPEPSLQHLCSKPFSFKTNSSLYNSCSSSRERTLNRYEFLLSKTSWVSKISTLVTSRFFLNLSYFLLSSSFHFLRTKLFAFTFSRKFWQRRNYKNEKGGTYNF